ncbi:MAG: hypothetical protein JST76_03655 [Bacteroidetes bacterium]|nr:hypothetical protein [Bacteroidota bacterium]
MKRYTGQLLNYLALVPVLALTLIGGTGCKKTSVPSVSTGSVTSITATGARAAGTVLSDGGAAVTERGVCWSTSGQPTISDYKANDGSSGTGSFATNITGLTSNVTYYVRAYALNSAGVGYGEVRSFTASATSPDAVTLAATDIHSTTATLHAWVNGNNQSTSVSFEYGTSTAYGQTIAASPATVHGTSDSATAALAGLTPLATYHYRVKITNIYGTAYGADMTFYTGYVVGEHTLGGLVFYTDQTGTHGLVCTDSSIASSVAWYNGTYMVTGATGTAIGTGLSNSNSIVAAQGSGNYAAYICRHLTYNGYSDWYLPSADEFQQIVTSDAGFPLVIPIGWLFFWSSSEVDANNAYMMQVPGNHYCSKVAYDKNATGGPGTVVGSTVPAQVVAIRKF